MLGAHVIKRMESSSREAAAQVARAEENEGRVPKEMASTRAELEGLTSMNALLSQQHLELGKSLQMRELDAMKTRGS